MCSIILQYEVIFYQPDPMSFNYVFPMGWIFFFLHSKQLYLIFFLTNLCYFNMSRRLLGIGWILGRLFIREYRPRRQVSPSYSYTVETTLFRAQFASVHVHFSLFAYFLCFFWIIYVLPFPSTGVGDDASPSLAQVLKRVPVLPLHRCWRGYQYFPCTGDEDAASPSIARVLRTVPVFPLHRCWGRCQTFPCTGDEDGASPSLAQVLRTVPVLPLHRCWGRCQSFPCTGIEDGASPSLAQVLRAVPVYITYCCIH